MDFLPCDCPSFGYVLPPTRKVLCLELEFPLSGCGDIPWSIFFIWQPPQYLPDRHTQSVAWRARTLTP